MDDEVGEELDDEVDLEIEAMREISKALKPLDEAARIRVLRWASDRYDIEVAVLGS